MTGSTKKKSFPLSVAFTGFNVNCVPFRDQDVDYRGLSWLEGRGLEGGGGEGGGGHA